MSTPIPENHAPFGVEEVALATGGRLVCAGPASRSVSTDSRTLARGALFVALTGERFDGHAYLEDVAGRGASLLVVSRAVDVGAIARAAEGRGLPSPGIVEVSDTRAALGALGRAHRARWAAGSPERRLVAITGSAGKTTTKTVLAALLEVCAPGEVHVSRGNLNNEIGLPMSLLGLDPRHRFAVVEIGTSGRGEIARLAAIAAPDVAALTLVALAHAEGLGSLEVVAQEKGDLLAALPPDGFAAANADDALASRELDRSPARRRMTFGSSARADYRVASRRVLGAEGLRVAVERPRGRLEVDLPLLGAEGAQAFAGALCLAEAALGRPLAAAEVERALERLAREGPPRLVPLSLPGGVLLLDDTYNANPASMRASIATAREIAEALGRTLVLVLGEMLELGDAADREHSELGVFAARQGPRRVVAVRGLARGLAREVEAAGVRAEFAPDADAAARLVLSIVQPGDLVLVKGSRGVRTEKVVEALRNSWGESGGPAAGAPGGAP